MLLIEDIHYVDVKDPVFKYRLLMDIANQVDFLGLKLKEDIHNDYCSLFTDGLIIGRKLYAYDGASGPTKDTKDTMHGALDHDIFWQLIEEGFLGEEWREVSNAHLKKQCIADSKLLYPDKKLSHKFMRGVSSVRFFAWRWSVTIFGRPYIKFKKWHHGRS